MASEEIKPTSGYSRSDKLGIALACLAGIMAIILFLVEKTPYTVVGLLTLMIALAIYPVWHFVRPKNARIALLVLAVVGTVAFGWAEWPRNKKIETQSQPTPQPHQLPNMETPPAVTPIPQADAPKAPEVVKSGPPAMPQPPQNHPASQQQSGKDNTQIGPIITGPCSNVQLESNGTQTTNCVQSNPNDPVVTYNFAGAKTVVTPGQPTQIYRYSDQDEASAYDQISSLQGAQNWKGLAALCEQEIKKAPEWPTAYMCAGEAYAGMNQREKACDLLNQAAALAGKNKQWEGARFMAWQLRCLHTK
jgi:outer membrane biosynthesis protein TonB